MFSRKKILVVEDAEINRQILLGILSGEYEVVEAENGKEALDLLHQYGEGISLILLDLVMPVMDGFTFLGRMKADPAISSIPVIVATQSGSEEDEISALSQGATDFITKPYKAQIIRHRVASIINLRETSAMMNLMEYDRLTGLYSKEFFYQKVRRILDQNPEKQYDIICSDIENFKLVNDVFGVKNGDRLLRYIADHVLPSVGGNGIFGRMSSDIFVCLMERGAEYTTDLFERANQELNQFTDAGTLVMKWGIYRITDPTISVDQMCDRAALAIESIKGRYGKYFAYYDENLRKKMLLEQSITDSMETALATKQFLIYLQPKYNIQTGRLSGAEALVRWLHSERGFLSPGEFIPLFEKNGFITKLDQYIWEGTCALIRNWMDRGLPVVPISVNVSRADIYNENLPVILKSMVERYQLSPAQLHLEITESAYTENPKQIIDTVAALRDLGFVIEMDDFGSGYSSLNMLNELPIDVLKLDIKFIQNETAKVGKRSILRFIIELARWMNLQVIAEGVETEEQMQKLLAINCRYAQGYYLARPVPNEEFEGFLTNKNAEGEEGEDPEDSLSGEAFQGGVILVADGQAACRETAKQTLTGTYEVVEMKDGDATLDYLKRESRDIVTALISLDLPGIGGMELLDRIRGEAELAEIPVILTGAPGKENKRRALKAGAEDYVESPFDPVILKNTVRLVVRASQLEQQGNMIQNQASLMQRAAYSDFLTGLLNRRGFEAAVEELGNRKESHAVFIFDLDDLKQCNDTFGHPVGDRLLKQFGVILRSEIRTDDIAARIGGDEFLVVMKNMPSAEAAQKKGQRICEAARNCELGEELGMISCSAGTTMYRTGESLDEVILRADKALYRAKGLGKGRCCLWEEQES